MAIKTIEQLKKWFGRGCYPTASQFGDLIDSFRHKDAEISLTEIRGLAQELNRKYDGRQGALLLARVQALSERHDQLAGELENQLAAIGYSKENFAEILDIVEKYAELSRDIDNIDDYIIPQEIQPQIDYNREAVDRIEGSIGAPTRIVNNGSIDVTVPGIAPLNESGVIAARFLPSFVDDVMDFDGMVTWEGSFAGKLYEGDLSEVEHRVLFNPAAKRFILEVTPVSSTGKPQTPQYYPVWTLEENQQLCLGAPSAAGYLPLTSKTYYCPKTTVSYRWNGTSLAPCGSHLELGKEVNTAYPGDAGKALEEQKADRTELSPVLARDPEEGAEAVEPDFLTLMLRKNEQALSEEERRQVMENLGDPQKQALIDRWNSLCEIADYNYLTPAGNISSKRVGQYNKNTGYFELYDTLFDITADEAIKIIEASTAWAGYAVAGDSFAGTAYLNSSSVLNCGIRALLPIANPNHGGAISLRGLYYAGVIGLCYYYTNRPVPVSNLRQYDVARCVSPMDISGINYTSGATEGFYNFSPYGNVKYILLHGLKCDLPLERCPNIEMECIEYAVDHAANTKPITITLHADAFARCTPELLAKAAAKNITITTP